MSMSTTSIDCSVAYLYSVNLLIVWPFEVLTVRSSCFSTSKPICMELDCEENKLKVRVFDKQ